jgi:chaperonin GroES
MKVKPLSDRVLVKPTAKDEVTKSGIVIPDTVDKERPEQGEVVAVGPGRVRDDGQINPMSVKEGDKVMFRKYGPDEVKVDDEDLLIMSESDIIAVLED